LHISPACPRPPPPSSPLFPYTTLFRSLERRVDQQHHALFPRRHQRPWHVPAFTQVHDDALVGHVVLEQTPVFGMLFVKLQTILLDRKSTRLNSSHVKIAYAVFCLKKKN